MFTKYRRKKRASKGRQGGNAALLARHVIVGDLFERSKTLKPTP